MAACNRRPQLLPLVDNATRRSASLSVRVDQIALAAPVLAAGGTVNPGITRLYVRGGLHKGSSQSQ